MVSGCVIRVLKHFPVFDMAHEAKNLSQLVPDFDTCSIDDQLVDSDKHAHLHTVSR